jgi:hypothetical protein
MTPILPPPRIPAALLPTATHLLTSAAAATKNLILILREHGDSAAQPHANALLNLSAELTHLLTTLTPTTKP